MLRKGWIVLGLVVALAAGGGRHVLGGDSATAAERPGGTGITAHDMTIGNPKAKVVFIEYAAPMCPHCAHFNNEILPEIKKSYIDTGKVFYVFRVFPIGAPDGVAEKLARCLPRAQYFPFMDRLFRAQQEWDPEYGVRDVRGGLLKQAKAQGMSEKQFDACIADTKEDATINQVASDGQAKYNITGTPTIVIDGVNASPGRVPNVEQMKAFLDKALAGKKPV